jgi:steroid delta-isomerase-like uncharacterized protein
VTTTDRGPLPALIDALRRRDPDAASALFARDAFVRDVARGRQALGVDEVRDTLARWLAAVPDATFEVTALAETDERAGAQVVVRGTHTGPFADDWGPVPATGKPIDLPFAVVCALHDGRIVETHLYYDLATLLLAVGAL